ncbi:hypothetical protein CRE_21077, partial [Caenorhabditis remanei]
MDILLKISMVYGIISVFFMLFVILLLTFNKRFVYSFYRVIVMDILINFTCWLNTWPAKILFRPGVPDSFLQIHESFPWLTSVSQFLTTFFFHAQSLSTIVICAHRLISAKYENANKKWNRYYLFVYAGVIVFSVFITNFIYFQKIHFDYQERMFVLDDVSYVSDILN